MADIITKGIDVSKWQGDIDWNLVKQNGIEFAIIRSSFGKSSIDNCFEKNYQNAKAVGIKIGVYHYSYAKSVEDAKKEAEFCLSVIKNKKLEYPVAFDIEDPSQAALGKELLTEIAKEFCLIVESAGYYVVIYSNKDWLTNRLDMAELSRFDLWLAQWSNEATYTGNFGMWQYTSKGSVAGINGNVDLDYCYRDYAQIVQVNSLNGFQNAVQVSVAPTPSPMVKPAKQSYSKGSEINLKNIALYASATTSKKSATKSGIFYIYDGIRVNGRYRITNKPKNVERKPMSLYVTGWIEG